MKIKTRPGPLSGPDTGEILTSVVHKLADATDKGLNTRLCPTSLNTIYGGDKLAEKRRAVELGRLISYEITRSYEEALFTGEYIPCFPEIHEGRPFGLYDWGILDPELGHSEDPLVVTLDDNVYRFAANKVNAELVLEQLSGTAS